jgi:hypothetical protein
MSEKDFRSNAKGDFRVGDAGDSKSFWIDEPHSLDYGEGAGRVLFESIGGQPFRTSFVVNDGVVIAVKLVPNGLFTLDEAAATARSLEGQLEAVGFTPKPEDGWFKVWNWDMRAVPVKPVAASRQAAIEALSSGQAMVSEASLYAASTNHQTAVVAVRNGRRMRALVGNVTAKNENGAVNAREWSLELSFVTKALD